MDFKISDKVKRIIPVLLFFISIIWVYDYMGILRDLNKRPCSIHVWAQCERASIALNYYKNDMNFFKPQVHKFKDGDGTTGLEFPLVAYIPAICYKLFGFNEIYYRGLILLSMVFGLYFFYKLLISITNNYVLSLFLTAAGYFSPALIFYSNNFMPDVTSLGLVLAAWYYFFKFINQGYNNKDINLFWVFVLIATLIKVTSFIAMMVVICVLILDMFKFFKNVSRDFLFTKKQRIRIIVSFGLVSFFVTCWYMYANYLNQHSHSFTLSPTLDTDKAVLLDIWEHVKKYHTYEYYPYEAYVLFLSMLAILLIGFKFVNRLYFIITLFTILGSLCFAFLFFRQFKNHEYYIIPLLPCTFLLIVTFADFINRISIRYSKLIPYAFIVILFFNIKESFRACDRDYSMKMDQRYLRYMSDFESYWDLEPKLRAHGIQRTDYTLCGFDPSFCNSLYLMDQLGFCFDENAVPDQFEALMADPRYKYLVLSDTVKFNKMYPKGISKSLVTTHRGLLVYKLR